MNPARECRMCKLGEQTQRPMAELLAVLPEPEECYVIEHVSHEFGPPSCFEYARSTGAAEAAIPNLRDIAEGCPACMLAAMRQKGLIEHGGFGFDYQGERRNWLDGVNCDEMTACHHG